MTTAPGPLAAEFARLQRAQHYVDVRQPERALAELDGLTGELAVSLEAQLLRTVAHLHTNHPDRALHTARQALADHGPSPDLCRLHAHALRATGEDGAAEQAVLQGLGLDPTDPGLLCLYAEICIHADQLPKAQELLNRAAREAPEADAVMRGRILIEFASGRAARARELTEAYLARDPENPDARALHAMVSAERGDVDRAYSSSRRLVSADPGNRSYVDAATDLRLAAHPLMWPLRPIMRFGPAVMWLVQVVVVLGAVASGNAVLARTVTFVVVGWVVYSWVAPPLLRRWLRSRSR